MFNSLACLPSSVLGRSAVSLALSLVGLFASQASAAPAPASQAAQIRKSIGERMPTFPKIDQISTTPFAGLFEVRIGKDLFYTDAGGNYLMQGALLDTKKNLNLTQVRQDELNVVDFATLPLKDAIVLKQGSGERKLAVFSDPNCGYCKRLEKDLRQVKDVTIYTFLVPILAADSMQKSRNIWCSKDAGKSWLDWMLDGKAAAPAAAACDSSAMDRNLALGQRLHINATPVSVPVSGRMALGGLDTAELEQLLATKTR
ncbi:DsbC family protein [Paucibacter sp. AS339]|uniref:DsbC family protein n=1 Tax=Paucibacter hankyongi TaxID=3133434 RepID=UPI0030952A57